jgi:hypothetical protein
MNELAGFVTTTMPYCRMICHGYSTLLVIEKTKRTFRIAVPFYGGCKKKRLDRAKKSNRRGFPSRAIDAETALL